MQIMISKFLKKYIVPHVQFLHDFSEQALLIGEAYGGLEETNFKLSNFLSKKSKNTFPFMCPQCSCLLRIKKNICFDTVCYKCGTSFMEFFFGPQKIFLIDDRNTSWWVAAENSESAINEVLLYEKTNGLDLTEDDYWGKKEWPVPILLTWQNANTYSFYSNTERKTIWDGFVWDSSTRVIACSEW